MKMYSFDDIKRHGDCVRYLREIAGMQETGKEHGWACFNCPWRTGSDSGAFHAKAEGWYDHVDKEGGTLIDLRMRHAGEDLFQAAEWLGDWLNLSPGQVIKARKFVCAYDYTDENGELKYQVCRWELPPPENKTFSQRRPNHEKPGDYINDIDGITRYPYRLPAMLSCEGPVFIVEGEKDADNGASIGLNTTTNAGGSKNWSTDLNKWFSGRHIILVPDNDDPGREHAKFVMEQLRAVAADFRVINLPGLGPKEDISDWIARGGTKEQIMTMVESTPIIEKCDIPNAPAVTEKSEAKKANEFPFSNYRLIETDGPDGNSKMIKEPIQINALTDEVRRRFWGFPRRIGGIMFDHDRSDNSIKIIENASRLTSWIQQKSGHVNRWGKFEGCVSRDELFHAVYSTAPVYQSVSVAPSWPMRADVYYQHEKLPHPSPGMKYFDGLMEFFSPATEADRIMIRAMFASPLYYRPKVDRPLWIIDSTTGQESGKSKMAEMLAYLYGDRSDAGDPMWQDYKELNNEQSISRVFKRLLSESGRRKRIFVIDNVEGFFRSSALASMITQGSFTGMAPYGHGEETRPNDLTFVLTFNSASVGRDMVSRAFFVMLKRPYEPLKNWETRVIEYIDAHRMQIISDIVGNLEAGPTFDFTPQTRFKTWEKEVFAPMCGSFDAYETVFKANADRKYQCDGEREEAETLRELIVQKLQDAGINHESDPAWISTTVLVKWAREAIPDWENSKLADKSLSHIVRNFVKGGMIPEGSLDCEMVSVAGKKVRGIGWNFATQFDTGSGFNYQAFISEGDVVRVVSGFRLSTQK